MSEGTSLLAATGAASCPQMPSVFLFTIGGDGSRQLPSDAQRISRRLHLAYIVFLVSQNFSLVKPQREAHVIFLSISPMVFA